MNASIKAEHVAAACDVAWKLSESPPGKALGHFAQAIADAEQRGYERGIADAKTLEKLGAT